jgi:PAS domain S-box-containing protein
MERMNQPLKSDSVAGDSEGDAAAQAPENSGTIPEPMSILDQARDAIVLLGLDGSVRYWNRAAERIFEWPVVEAMERHAQDFLWANPSSADVALANVLATEAWNGPLAIVTKSGERRLVESRWSLLRSKDSKSRSILTIHSDITEKAKLQDEFARVQQLESITALARGFAHDLNNVLGPIIMAADLFKLTMRSQREMNLLETVEVSARRGSEIVKQMLAISKPQSHDAGGGSEAQAGRAGDGPPHGNAELILLIDDETSIRLVTGRTLEAYGYQVITACDGADGLAKYTARRGEVAIVITDMMMPVMSGVETIRALLKLDPAARIIASSGVNMKGAEEEAARNGVGFFLHKPYTVAKLHAILKEALQSPSR